MIASYLSDEETEIYNKKPESEAVDVPNQHLIHFGNKVYHAEKYIKQTEYYKDIIKDALQQLELYFMENAGDLRMIDASYHALPKRTLDDALYFLNKIKECVEEK